MLAKLLILALSVALVHPEMTTRKPEDDADCNACMHKKHGVCNLGNTPTTCDNKTTGCYQYEWRDDKWVTFHYPSANCHECENVHHGTDCNEINKTCTTSNGCLFWNCNKNEECSWQKQLDPNACN